MSLNFGRGKRSSSTAADRGWGEGGRKVNFKGGGFERRQGMLLTGLEGVRLWSGSNSCQDAVHCGMRASG